MSYGNLNPTIVGRWAMLRQGDWVFLYENGEAVTSGVRFNVTDISRSFGEQKHVLSQFRASIYANGMTVVQAVACHAVLVELMGVKMSDRFIVACGLSFRMLLNAYESDYVLKVGKLWK